ncbi:hypothetical protein [Aliivibrio fischeri]|uniref:hypothetical protein n=1 Tax=Aliivibrio fischeri TaxID=668 RepID=UPI0007C5DA0D|nr:hypothetical protein [Aliivibrio fischeri]
MSNLSLAINNDETNYFQTPDEITREFEISAKTSIARKTVSAPLKQFLSQYPDVIQGSCLNFAKGRERESLDTKAIMEISGQCSEYDYTFANDASILKAHYNFVYVGYCTNVLTPLARMQVWKTLATLSGSTGIVVVASRSSSDRGIKGKPEFDGYRTLRGTFQLGYQKGMLLKESKTVFPFAIELPTKGAYRMVACSHSPFSLLKIAPLK